MTVSFDACDQIESATSYLDVFGEGSGDSRLLLDYVKKRYRQLAVLLHPDMEAAQKDPARCEAAFKRLAELRRDADQAIMDDCYGTPRYIAALTTKRAVHNIRSIARTGSIAATYVADSTIGSVTRPTFCKLARDAQDNDLLKNEATALKRLRSINANPQWTAFMPELIDTFQTNTGTRKVGNAVAFLDGFYDLNEVKQAIRGPLEPLHAVWIWRRLLVALGHAHDNQVIHGAVLPCHVMIQPEQHGLVLVDWCYASVRVDGEDYAPLKAIVSEYREWYPSEVMAKQRPTPATDIYLAARTLIDLMGGNPVTSTLPDSVPRQLRAFFRGCLSLSPAARPQSAWLLLQEFDELLETMGAPYYPRRFRPFTMPQRHV